MRNQFRSCVIFLSGLAVSGLVSFLCRHVIVSNMYNGTYDAYEVLGSSIISALTMNDRWVNYGEIIGNIPNLNETLFSILMSGLKEDYNPQISMTKTFNDDDEFYEYMSSRYTEDHVSYIRSFNNISIHNLTRPIVYTYPPDISIIGYNVMMIPGVGESISRMESTGQPDIIGVPKGLPLYDTESILYGVPIKVDGRVDTIMSIQLYVEDALVKETKAVDYLEEQDFLITISSSDETTTIFSSSETGHSYSYMYSNDWTPRKSINIFFSFPDVPNMWFLYLLISLGLAISTLLTYIDVKYEQKGEIATQKSKFLSRISHEIRTPINGIVGAVESVVTVHGSDKEENIYIRTIRSCTEHLLNLVTNVLELSQVEAGQIHVNQHIFNVSIIKDHIMNTWETMFPKECVSIEVLYENVPEDIQIMGDSGKINQVIYNLLSNAVKFTEKGSIVVSVKWEEVKPMEYGNILMRISVKDSGIGIPVDCMPHIFDQFVQLRNNTLEQGSGIGLSVARSLAVSMNGSLTCTSTEGSGSEFVFSFRVFGNFMVSDSSLFKCIPYKEKKEDLSDVSKDPIELSNSFSALVVDDNVINVKILSRIVSKYLNRCDTAMSGTRAIEMCKEREYDVIFMDKFMPGCDGIQATKSIRESGKNTKTSIIFVTADVTGSSSDECIRAGGTEYVTKPVTPYVVHELIKKYVIMLQSKV